MRHLVTALGAAALAAACASTQAPPSRPPGAAPAPTPAPAQQAGSDWHALLVLPFGTLLNEVPFALDEVIVFEDSQAAAGDREDIKREERDCYVPRGLALPAFLGRQPREYRLCFSSDRLHRIDATVDMPASGAREEFAAACAGWQGRQTGAPEPAGCEGRADATTFRARLVTDGPQASISISLTGGAPAP